MKATLLLWHYELFSGKDLISVKRIKLGKALKALSIRSKVILKNKLIDTIVYCFNRQGNFRLGAGENFFF